MKRQRHGEWLGVNSASDFVRRLIWKHLTKEIKMDVSKFRSTQAPLKDRYKKDAKSAFLTLKAMGTTDDASI